MILRQTRQLQHRARQALRRLRARDEGSVAVEFAMIAPILITLYIGVFQISMLIMQDRNVSHSASVLGDLATQTPALLPEDVQDIMQAGVSVLNISNKAVFTNGDVEMRMVSLEKPTATSDPVVIGEVTIGDSWDGDDPTTWEIDERLLSETSGAVIAQVRYDFAIMSHGKDSTPGKNRFIGGSKMLSETFILKPRVSSTVPFDNEDGGHSFTCTIGDSGENIGKVSCNPA